MFPAIPPQLIALGAALSYAISGIAARRGMRYSTPITVTLVSMAVHAVTLWAAVLLTGGIPSGSLWVLFLFALTGILQHGYPAFHLCRYFLCRRFAGNNIAECSSSFQHQPGDSVSRRTGKLADSCWNCTDCRGNNADLVAVRNSESLISLVAHRLPVGRRLFGRGQSSASALCFESGQRASLSYRDHRDRRTALVGKLSLAAKQKTAGGLGSEMYSAISRCRTCSKPWASCWSLSR